MIDVREKNNDFITYQDMINSQGEIKSWKLINEEGKKKQWLTYLHLET